ncbi:hypothetical protein C8J56DRAFT_1160195 [Mycena floridula]|nr:hypothetical protein C8J56DRAFT_1160195 [Mycena floridula]
MRGEETDSAEPRLGQMPSAGRTTGATGPSLASLMQEFVEGSDETMALQDRVNMLLTLEQGLGREEYLDRGEIRRDGLERYQMESRLGQNVIEVMEELQNLLISVVGTLPERGARVFRVDPTGAFSEIFRGTNNLALLQLTWGAFCRRLRLALASLVKYQQEYIVPAPSEPFSPASTAPELWTACLEETSAENRMAYMVRNIPHHRDQFSAGNLARFSANGNWSELRDSREGQEIQSTSLVESTQVKGSGAVDLAPGRSVITRARNSWSALTGRATSLPTVEEERSMNLSDSNTSYAVGASVVLSSFQTGKPPKPRNSLGNFMGYAPPEVQEEQPANEWHRRESRLFTPPAVTNEEFRRRYAASPAEITGAVTDSQPNLTLLRARGIPVGVTSTPREESSTLSVRETWHERALKGKSKIESAQKGMEDDLQGALVPPTPLTQRWERDHAPHLPAVTRISPILPPLPMTVSSSSSPESEVGGGEGRTSESSEHGNQRSPVIQVVQKAEVHEAIKDQEVLRQIHRDHPEAGVEDHRREVSKGEEEKEELKVYPVREVFKAFQVILDLLDRRDLRDPQGRQDRRVKEERMAKAFSQSLI